MEFKEKRYRINEVELGVLEAGNPLNPVILFLHGFPEVGEAWHRQMRYFAERGFRAVAPDQRGYNGSSKPKGIKSYVLPQLTADVVALIQQLTDQKIYLVGHDWGGAVAWNLATHFPELLQALIILNMPHPAVMHQHLETNPRQQLRSWYTGFFQLPWLPEQLLRAFKYHWLARSMRFTALPGTFFDDKIDRYKSVWRQPGALSAMLNWYRAYKYTPFKATHPVAVPTLLIWGKKDTFLGSEMAQASVEQCQNGKLEFIENATHWLHHEQPERVNELIWDFMGNLLNLHE